MIAAIVERRRESEEGVRSKPYRDKVGKLTIGIGRNLDDVGVSFDEARFLAMNDIARDWAALIVDHPWIMGLNEVRQEVFCDMAFNLGEGHLDTFKDMLSLAQGGQFGAAATAGLQSVWATQVASAQLPSWVC